MNRALPASHDACVTRKEWAAWLLRAPLATLLRDEMTIRNRLRLSGFREGLVYLDAELAMLRAERREDGQTVDYIGIAIARGLMSRIDEGLPPVGLAGKP